MSALVQSMGFRSVAIRLGYKVYTGWIRMGQAITDLTGRAVRISLLNTIYHWIHITLIILTPSGPIFLLQIYYF
jgi:hypothetical protein